MASVDQKYAVLLRAAQIVAEDRAVLLGHHRRINQVLMDMLVGRKKAKRDPNAPTKDNPTGDPFKRLRLRRATPTAVSSRFDQSLNALRAARDVPDSAYD